MQDRKALAKPWTGTLYYELRNDWDLGEISCSGDFNNFESFSFTGLSREDVVAIAAIGVTGFTASTDP
jgi:hypothetical protein